MNIRYIDIEYKNNGVLRCLQEYVIYEKKRRM